MLAILLVFTYFMRDSFFPSIRTKALQQTRGQMREHVRNFRTCIQDPGSWSVTVKDPKNPKAIRCVLGGAGCESGKRTKIRLWSAGRVEELCVPGYDPLDPSHGFTEAGTLCRRFRPEGNSSCPYRIEFDWMPFCPNGATHCESPIEVVVASVIHNPGKSIAGFPIKFGDGMVRSGFENVQTWAEVRGRDIHRNPLVLMETKPPGAPGGACAAGSFTQRKLNFIQGDLGFVVARVDSSNGSVVLLPGTYECRISAPAYLVGRHAVVLRNLNTGRNLVRGSNEYSPDFVGYTQSRSTGSRRFELKEPTAVGLFHFCEQAPKDPEAASLSLGVPTGFLDEVYGVVSCSYISES